MVIIFFAISFILCTSVVVIAHPGLMSSNYLSQMRQLVDLDEYPDSQPKKIDETSYMCPLSRSMNTTEDDYFGYPMEIFAPDQYTKVMNLPFEKQKSYELIPCSCPNSRHRFSNCSTHTECPISKAVFNAARKRVQWNYTHNFCALNRALHTPGETVRVIDFGGSVSMGENSNGCKCWASQETPQCLHMPRSVEERDAWCPWSRYFAHWLGKTSNANVKLHNLADHGFNTWMTNLNFWPLMRKAGIETLTENDIIFIDESINDAFGGCSNCQSDLVALIHRILSISEDYSWPTIVLLLHTPEWPESTMFETPGSYNTAAAKLRLPMWSARDILQDMPESIRYYQNESGYTTELHVGWWTHLYLADLYSSLFQFEMEQCKVGHGNSPFMAFRDEMNASFVPKPEKVSELDKCDDRHPAIEFSALRPQSLGNVTIVQTGSWAFRHDRPKKFGWIAELPADWNASSSSMATTTALSSKISFRLTVSQFDTADWILKLYYLRTYENAGQVKITVCGNPLYGGHIDALWNKRVSIPVLGFFVMHGYSVLENNQLGCNASWISVELTHMPLIGTDVDPNRRRQKVKIIGLELCRLLR